VAIHLYYFENREGDIQLPPTYEVYFTLCPKGYDRREANTLDEVDKLQKRLQEQTYKRCQAEQLRDEISFATARRHVIDSLQATLHSAATSQYERDFIRYYLEVHQPAKREEYKKRFACDRAFLEMREMDKPRNPEETLGESL
jgi:hypothetical protein